MHTLSACRTRSWGSKAVTVCNSQTVIHIQTEAGRDGLHTIYYTFNTFHTYGLHVTCGSLICMICILQSGCTALHNPDRMYTAQYVTATKATTVNTVNTVNTVTTVTTATTLLPLLLPLPLLPLLSLPTPTLHALPLELNSQSVSYGRRWLPVTVTARWFGGS